MHNFILKENIRKELICILTTIYFSIALLYNIPNYGSLKNLKEILFIIILVLSFSIGFKNKLINYFFSLLVIIIFQIYPFYQSSNDGRLDFLYFFSLPLFVIFFFDVDDNLFKYFKYAILFIVLISLIYIYLSYNLSIYDFRTQSFGTISTNWSIGLAFYALYSSKLKNYFLATTIIYYAILVSGGRAGILTALVGLLLVYSFKKKYFYIFIIILITCLYHLAKPNVYLNNNSDRELIFFPSGFNIWNPIVLQKTDIDITETDIDSTETDIDSTETDIDSTETDIDSTETDSNITESIQQYISARIQIYKKPWDIDYLKEGSEFKINIKHMNDISLISFNKNYYLYYLDLMSAFRIQQYISAIIQIYKKPWGTNFDESGKALIIEYDELYILNIHNTILYNTVRGGLGFLIISIYLIFLIFKFQNIENQILLFTGLIPTIFESHVLIGGFNLSLIWWFIFAYELKKLKTKKIDCPL
jgi:hypothetical protein